MKRNETGLKPVKTHKVTKRQPGKKTELFKRDSNAKKRMKMRFLFRCVLQLIKSSLKKMNKIISNFFAVV
jgi:hypothetical protein